MRALERYGVEFSEKDLIGIAKKIQRQEGVFLTRLSNTKSVWLIEWKGRIYRVGYGAGTKQVATFLPMPNVPNDILLDMFDKLGGNKKKKKRERLRKG